MTVKAISITTALWVKISFLIYYLGREWTQNLYQSIYKTFTCSVAVKFKTLALITDIINIKSYCRSDDCNALYTLICSNISVS